MQLITQWIKTLRYEYNINGNGVNRLNDVVSWENLVHVIDDSNDNCKVPNTLQYEGKVLSVPFETKAKIRTSDGNILVTPDHKILTVRTQNEVFIKQEVANQMKAYRSNDLFDELLRLNVEHYITTNYDYVTDNALQGMSYSEDLSERDKSENTFSINRKKVISIILIKNIFGEFMENFLISGV